MAVEMYPCHGELDTIPDVLAVLTNMIRDTAEKLGEVTYRYKVMCDECEKLEKNLEDYRERAGRITDEDFELEIPNKDIRKWMNKCTVTQCATGRTTTIAKFCLEYLLNAKEEKIKANADAAAELQEEIKQRKESAEKLIKE